MTTPLINDALATLERRIDALAAQFVDIEQRQSAARSWIADLARFASKAAEHASEAEAEAEKAGEVLSDLEYARDALADLDEAMRDLKDKLET